MNSDFFAINEEKILSLRNNYPVAEYMPKANAPEWLGKLGNISKENIGIQVLLGTPGLKINILKVSLN